MRLQAILATLLIALAAPAAADTFVWKDVDHDYTASFPDMWRVQTPDGPYNRLRIAGPVAEDMATCKIDVQKDGRLTVYNKGLLDEAVTETLNQKFWSYQIGQFDNARLDSFYSPASLGDKGDATAIHMSFTQKDGSGNKIPMGGVMIGSIYDGDLYVASCSSRLDTFGRYKNLFGSILDSIQLESKYHPFPTGYYRNFLMDPKLVLARSKPGTVDEVSSSWFNFGSVFSRDADEDGYNN
jgi:hypothetical protein